MDDAPPPSRRELREARIAARLAAGRGKPEPRFLEVDGPELRIRPFRVFLSVGATFFSLFLPIFVSTLPVWGLFFAAELLTRAALLSGADVPIGLRLLPPLAACILSAFLARPAAAALRGRPPGFGAFFRQALTAYPSFPVAPLPVLAAGGAGLAAAVLDGTAGMVVFVVVLLLFVQAPAIAALTGAGPLRALRESAARSFRILPVTFSLLLFPIVVSWVLHLTLSGVGFSKFPDEEAPTTARLAAGQVVVFVTIVYLALLPAAIHAATEKL